jgi:hypothetical protein
MWSRVAGRLYAVRERREEGSVSFFNGMVDNVIKGMTPEQREDLLRGAREQLIATTTPQERAALLRETILALVESLPWEHRAALARELPLMAVGDRAPTESKE